MPNRFNLPSIKDNPEGFERQLQTVIGNLADQTATNPTANASGAPPSIAGINVVAAGGIHDVQIQDNTPAARGLHYFADYSDTPDFQNYHTIAMGPSQNMRFNHGPGQLHWRGYSSYPSSSHSAPLMHGGATATPVGTGTAVGPPLQPKQGSTGFGPVYRNSKTPPTRS
jgi:hypothetical protein